MAATPPAPATTGKPFLPNSVIWEKKGPLPVWAWAALLLAAVVGFMYWRARRAGGGSSATYTDLPSDQTQGPVFIVPGGPAPIVNVSVDPNATNPTSPPGAGGGTLPTTPPATPTPTSPLKFESVKVEKYTSKNPPWSSTLTGIFAHFKGKTTATSWQAIWNHPLNKDLRTKRGDPTRIRPGDIIKVPVR